MADEQPTQGGQQDPEKEKGIAAFLMSPPKWLIIGCFVAVAFVGGCYFQEYSRKIDVDPSIFRDLSEATTESKFWARKISSTVNPASPQYQSVAQKYATVQSRVNGILAELEVAILCNRPISEESKKSCSEVRPLVADLVNSSQQVTSSFAPGAPPLGSAPELPGPNPPAIFGVPMSGRTPYPMPIQPRPVSGLTGQGAPPAEVLAAGSKEAGDLVRLNIEHQDKMRAAICRIADSLQLPDWSSF